MNTNSATHRNATGLGILSAARWVLFLALTILRPLIVLAFAIAARLCLVGVAVNVFALGAGKLDAVWFALASLAFMAGHCVLDLLLQAIAPPSKATR